MFCLIPSDLSKCVERLNLSVFLFLSFFKFKFKKKINNKIKIIPTSKVQKYIVSKSQIVFLLTQIVNEISLQYDNSYNN